MTEESTKQSKFLLKGNENFVAWLTKLNNHCYLKDLMNGSCWPDETVTPEPTEIIPNPSPIQPTSTKLKAAKTIKEWINENIDHSVISFNATDSLKNIMDNFHNSFGTMHLDPEAFKEHLKREIILTLCSTLNPLLTGWTIS